jgi:hypothetical protein
MNRYTDSSISFSPMKLTFFIFPYHIIKPTLMNYEETRPTTTRFKVQNKITVYKIKHFRKNKKQENEI